MRSYRTGLIVFLAVALRAGACYAAQGEGSSISGQFTLPEIGPSYASHFSTPLIDLTKIKPSTSFALHVGPRDVLRIKYVDTSGTLVEEHMETRKAGCTRDGHTIVCETEVPNVGARILPGISRQTKRITYRRDQQGDLQLIRNHIERGWIFFLIPFHENHESSLTLEAAH